MITQTSLEQYQVLRILGKGGMGTVYLARHRQQGYKVAIKELKPQFASDPLIRSRFANEAALMSNLKHPNIVGLYDYVESKEGIYLVMEYIEGITLDYYIHNVSGPIPEKRALEVFNKILDAVAYAHTRGIIHRDLKPSNIMISPIGNIKVLDFGIAKNIYEKDQTPLTQIGVRMGTIYYMSPEQVRAQPLDHRSDIYSLGICLFEMLTATNPYLKEASEYDISRKIVNEPLPPVGLYHPKVSTQTARVIAKATAKAPDARFQNVASFKKALVPAGAIQTPSFEPSPTVEWIIEPLNKQHDSLPKDSEADTLPQAPERFILENQFGRISNQKVTFYRGKDLFEKGEPTEIPLKYLISAELSTHHEIISGVVFLTLAVLMVALFFNVVSFMIALGLMGLAGISFMQFPTLVLVRKDLKKAKMRAWPWHLWAAQSYIFHLQDALDSRE